MVSRWFRAWGMTISMFICSVALGFEIPDYENHQHVYFVPVDYGFRPDRVIDAALNAERPAWVTVYETTADAPVGMDSSTVRAIDAVWASWREQGADTREGFLLLLDMDRREIRAVAGSRWDAEIGLHTTRLGELIDEHFMPHAIAGDMDMALAELIEGVDSEIGNALAALARKAWLVRTAQIAIPAVLLLIALLSAGFAARRRRQTALKAAAAFAAQVAAWMKQLDQAEENLAGLSMDVELRDRLVDLKLKGPESVKAFHRVSEQLEDLHAGLAGLRRVIQQRQRQTETIGSLEVEAWRTAGRDLRLPFEVDTGELSGRLFESRTRKVSFEPDRFMDNLEATWTAVSAGWDLITDAVQASLSTAERDFDLTGRDALLASLDAVGLSARWAAAHPLSTNPAALWRDLDLVRRQDPVAYLKRLAELAELEDDLMLRTARVIDAKNRVIQAQTDSVEPSVNGLDTIIDDSNRDPAGAEVIARDFAGRLAVLGQAGEDADAYVERSIDVIEAFTAWRECKVALLVAVQTASDQITHAAEANADLRRRLDQSRSRVAAMIARHEHHTLREGWIEIAEAAEDLHQADTALEQARAALAQKRHVRAEQLAKRSLNEHGEAVVDLEELSSVLDELDHHFGEATTLFDKVDQLRAEYERQLKHVRGFGNLESLKASDLRYTELKATWTIGPADWEARHTQLKDLISFWKSTVKRAQRTWENELLEKEAATMFVQAQSSSQGSGGSSDSSSFGSSFSSSRSSYSSMSSRSSSRSGGSSFSSSSRSGGSSFGGGTRSGGRRF